MNLNRVIGFGPIADEKVSVLILGSMPGVESLRKKQYYANARNLFWYIMGELLLAGPDLKYENRTRMLIDSGVALWDVLKSCNRAGSLDSAIKDETIEANDFSTFLEDHPNITNIFFNGSKAETMYKRHVAPNLAAKHRAMQYKRLPSTSPANTAMSISDKVGRWRIIIRFIKTSE